jgi:hypothetical protein
LLADSADVEKQTDAAVARAIGLAAAAVLPLAIWLTMVFGWVDWSAVVRWVRPRPVPIVLVGLVVLLLGAAVWTLRRGVRPKSPPARALSWWMFAVAAMVVIAVAWVATSWLLAEANAAKDPAAARVEAVKTGSVSGRGEQRRGLRPVARGPPTVAPGTHRRRHHLRRHRTPRH